MAYSRNTGGTPVLSQNTTIPERTSLFELRGAILDVGILRDTLLPSFALHSGLSLIAYGAGRNANRLEAKDWLWPSAQVVNAWWASVGRRVVYGNLSLGQALSSLSRPEYLLLGGVTIWGGRLFYRIVSRSQARGEDDPRYQSVKNEPGFWNDALWKIFLPEAVFQTVITLPFTAPFYHQGGVFTGYHPWIQALSIAVFGTGLAMEILADSQLDTFKQSAKGQNEVNKEGVWSVVRHPNYLGDFLVHASFPILLYSSDMLAPIELLGPLANYLFLRYIGGDRENEASQAARYTGEKKASFEAYQADEGINSFWPSSKQLNNRWLWNCVGLGVAFAGIEQVFHQLGLD